MVLQTTSHGGRNLSSKTQNKTAEETSIILIQKRHKVVLGIQQHGQILLYQTKNRNKFSKRFQPVTKAEVKMW